MDGLCSCQRFVEQSLVRISGGHVDDDMSNAYGHAGTNLQELEPNGEFPPKPDFGLCYSPKLVILDVMPKKTESMTSNMKLSEWERGVRLESRSEPSLFAFLWFYEWHLFDAVQKGEHSRGTYNWNWDVAEDGSTAQLNADWLQLHVNTTIKGADLSLEITNNTDHNWPSIAAIIPCVNPGDRKKPSERNVNFLDERHLHTYFPYKNGLALIKGKFPREIHFNHKYHSEVMSWEKEKENGTFVFDDKWPTSERNAYAGIMIRESHDNRYVMGIAWNSFLSAQGHNPWNCMHLSIKVGPLAQAEKKTFRGKMYLFEGSKEDCLLNFEKDFA